MEPREWTCEPCPLKRGGTSIVREIALQFMGKMVGKPLGWGPLKNQPHTHLISRGYLLGFMGYIPF